jgi:predicted nucleic acid-binding protein
MRILFDTSVLIAGFIDSHSKHTQAVSWLQRSQTKQVDLLVSAHSLLECYSVLTRLPVSPKITPNMARLLLQENVEKYATIITLNATDYLALIKRMETLGLSGGVIYDALILRAAEKAKANKLLTLNQRDFLRLCPEHESFIISP